jgi:CYTH domain-containing protein
MLKEIELKYIVNKLPDECSKSKNIKQYYFNYLKHKALLLKHFKKINFCTINEARVRVINNASNKEFVLTLKTGGLLKRLEYEKRISKKMTIKLLKNNTLSVIKKKRYEVKVDNLNIEFDVYSNLNKKLIVAEIELKNKPTKKQIDKVEYILKHKLKLDYKNVTKIKKYKNKNLSVKGECQNGC